MASPERISAARKHVEEIRRTKFSIGAPEPSLETRELYVAAQRLADRIYNHGFNFVSELIQNADENTYPSGVRPILELKVTPRDITFSGSAQTLIVGSNDVGFSEHDIDAICSIGKSTKRRRHDGLIGPRGIGFKSVLEISQRPYIFSNGYQITFTEAPGHQCPIPIVPEWVDLELIADGVNEEYAVRHENPPNTVIVLPLMPDKSNFVRQQLGQVQAECFLFLSKLEQLTITYIDSVVPFPPLLLKVINRNTEQTIRNDSHSDSSVISLMISSGFKSACCKYYLYRQEFPMKPVLRVDERKPMENMVIGIACPLGQRLSEGFPVGIFSQFPSRIMTRFPFLIHSDFVPTRFMDMDFDNKWNKEVFNYVPAAFSNALLTFINSGKMSKDDAGAHAITWLPINAYSIGRSKEAVAINSIQRSIEAKVKDLALVPYDSLSEGNIHFARSCDVRMILPDFRAVLYFLRHEHVRLKGMRPGEKSPVCQSLDIEPNSKLMEHIGVDLPQSDPDWYDRCIQDCNLVQQLNEDIYVIFLLALALNWSVLGKSAVADTPILKYAAEDNTEKLCSVSTVKKSKIKLCFAMSSLEHIFLSGWHQRLGFPGNLFLLPNEIQGIITNHQRRNLLCAWLKLEANVSQIAIHDYSSFLIEYLQKNRNHNTLIQLPHFLHESKVNCFLWESDVCKFCQRMPIVDDSGDVHVDRTVILVPRIGSKWMKLFGFNPFAENNYIPLGRSYDQIQGATPDFMSYLCKYTNAVDLPELWPPNVELPITCSHLTAEQAFLLLDWLKCLRNKADVLPELFMQSIRNGTWMKTITGFSSPSRCILFGLQGASCDGFIMPTIDEEFYENRLGFYIDELKFIGVTVGCPGSFRKTT
ncbi:hypothetical protein J5N97_024188 [Dioscorea zingiberensis]|uniref:Sacsin/Nov domain-containing protein n=1 Tax=Dioscorea zingiberensis TaxID=325984 RepID=A0A9D5C5Y3_9LILI|nr:hypothetical protein J5N97_024188 [Dioscorea zingiberensis]